MNQPLGHAIGNALEVKEAAATLRQGGPPDFWRHCLEVAGHMVLLAGRAHSLDEAKTSVTTARDDGRAWNKFRELLKAQGGDARQVDDPDHLPQAHLVEPILADGAGAIAAIDTGAIGWACVRLGGGRLVKNEKIDHAVGFVLPCKVGDTFSAGEPIGYVHANDAEKLAQARSEVLASITWSDQPVEPLPGFYGIIN